MSTNGPLLLSLDIGTTAIKVGLFTAAGELLEMATREQQLIMLEEGKIEQSPQETWELLSSGVREVMNGYSPSDAAGIALSLQRGTVVPLDKHGRPVTNLIVWMDQRGLPLARQMEKQIGSEFFYNISGHPITYITGVSKVLWVYRNLGDLREQVAIIGPPETLFLRWLGCEEFVCADSTGTYLFPFDIHAKQWSETLAGLLDFPLKMLPKLVSSIDVVGYLSKEAAEKLGLRPGIPLVPGGGDGQCAAAGCGVVSPSLCMINIGTGTGVQTYLPKPLMDPARVLNCAAHVVPDGWEMEGHTQASGAVFRWFRDEFGALELAFAQKTELDAFDLLVRQAGLAPPGCDGLLLLPTFNGSTAPEIDQDARGAFLGLALSHSRNHVIRALLEGISLEIRWMLDAIIDTGAAIKDLRLVGGGARNRTWNQIHADILDRPISTLEITEAALVGAAMCAAVAVGEYRDLAEAAGKFVHLKETIHPQKKNRAVYRTTYENYWKAFKLLSQSDIFEDLAEQISTQKDS